MVLYYHENVNLSDACLSILIFYINFRCLVYLGLFLLSFNLGLG